MTHHQVVVTGIGLATAAGIGRDATWSAVCSGRGTAASVPLLAGLPVDFGCTVPGMEAAVAPLRRKAWRLDRFARLAVLTAREALADARLDPAEWDAGRVGVVVGSGCGGVESLWEQQGRLRDRGPEAVSPLMYPLTLINMAAGEVALDCGAAGPSLATVTACASGADALAVARTWLTTGVCNIVLAGGAEAGLTRLHVTGFERLGVLSHRRDDPASASRPFDACRDGFVMGEAAAVLVLERLDHAQARGVPVRAVFAGCGSATDAHHPTAPHPEGAGAQRALERALADADVHPREVDHVNAHGTATPLNDTIEAGVITRVLPHGPTVTSAKGALGHTLGAAGAVEAALTVLTIHHALVPPTANLRCVDPAVHLDLVRGAARPQRVEVAVSHSFGFGGHNTVLVFRAG
ncbi:beta-ketoacyl-[acyl-carrier-protein] synthase family protein [Streptomyces sp. NPDC053048]|uniref:beta-ketoacyl-[acyl-carrier-protein] synthase family protein n=1 Tax=Streptomyces sp. NPDC053048 TaxID=3365694 RepID=UPI0037D82DF8